MSELVNDFNEYREKMNAVILGKNNLVMKRLGTWIQIHMKMVL